MPSVPQAIPQSMCEARQSPAHAEIVADARTRGITSIVHFTRTEGLKGILHTSAVRARRYLPHDARVKYVYTANAADRSRDLPWHGYVNLSVTEANLQLLQYSKGWHPGDLWVILEFGPEILGDPGVVFCTTNNAYEQVVSRCAGPEGFREMFVSRVPWGYHGTVSNRTGRALNQTTNPQAEVLYPYELPLDYLHTITVGDESTYETVGAILSHFPSNTPKVVVTPEAFP